MEDNHSSADNFIPKLTLTTQVRSNLKSAAKWSKFIAILMFINAGIMALSLIISVFFGFDSIGSSLWMLSDLGILESLIDGYDILFDMIAIVFAFIPALFLYRFATYMQIALQQEDQSRLFDSFVNLRLLSKFYGLLIIISIVVIVLFIVGFFISLFFVDFDPSSFG